MAGFGRVVKAGNLFPLRAARDGHPWPQRGRLGGAGTPGEIDGQAGYKLVLPVASGEIAAVGSGSGRGRG